MEMEKKNVALIILVIALAFSGAANIVQLILGGGVQFFPPAREQDLVFGTAGNIPHLDPHYAYDSASIDVIEQVCESLYTFDITDEPNNFPPIPALAVSMPVISDDGLNYTIALRSGVTFHDGTAFNASVVQWNFYRLLSFMNHSGNSWLPAPWNVPVAAGHLPTQIGILYEASTGVPIIAQVIVIDNFHVKFVLVEPKASWLSILCFSGSSMQSPTYLTSIDAMHEYIENIQDSKLVGTGPFKFEYYVPDYEVKFSPNPSYWQGPTNLTSLTFAIIEDDNARNQAMLSKNVDILDAPLPAFLKQFEATPGIHLERAGGTTTTFFIAFNYQKISFAARAAISYCFNYSYLIDVILEEQAVRWKSYIPEGISYANYSYDYPDFNVVKARQYLFDDSTYNSTLFAAGITPSSLDQDWIALAESPTPLESYNGTWNTESSARGDTLNRLAFDMKKIGMKLTVIGMAWTEQVNRMVYQREKLELYCMGWMPDYLDPENYINPMLSDTSAINGGNYYEEDVQLLMNAGLSEIDLVERNAIYQKIQQKLIERDMPWMILTTGINNDVWVTNLHGWITNSILRVSFYHCYFSD